MTSLLRWRLSLAVGLALCAMSATISLPAPARAEPADPDGPTPDELLKARWQRMMREADEKIADTRHQVETAKIALDAAVRQAITVPTGQSQTARTAAVDAVAAAEAALAAAQKAKEALLDRARQEGVPPGYLRN